MVPGSLVAVLAGSSLSVFGLDKHGVEDRRRHRRAVCRRSACPTTGSGTTSTPSPAAVGVMLVGFAEGLGPRRRTRPGTTTRSTRPRTDRRSAPRTSGSGLSSGMVVNGSLSKTAVNGARGRKSQLSGIVVAVLTGRHAPVPHRALRAAARGHARGGRHRRARRAGRRPGARRALPVPRPGAGRALRRRRPAGLHRGAGGARRRAGVRHAAGAVHRHRRFAASAALPRLAPARRRARAGAGDGRPVGRRGAPSRTTWPGVVVLASRAPFFANADAIRDAIGLARQTTCAPSSSTPPGCKHRRTAVNTLVGLAEDLARDGVELVIARDIAAVRDLVRLQETPGALRSYPTVQAAVDELTKQGRADAPARSSPATIRALLDLDLSGRARADPRHGARVRARARRPSRRGARPREPLPCGPLVEEMARLGLMGIPIPEEYGGSGGDTGLLRDRDRGADPRRLVGGDHSRRAHLRAGNDADPPVRERATEARVAAGARLGHPAGRVRAHRAWRRLRCRRHTHDRESRATGSGW